MRTFFLKIYSMRCLSLPVIMLILVTFTGSAQVVDGQNGEAPAGPPQPGSAIAGQQALLDRRIVVGILKPSAGRNRLLAYSLAGGLSTASSPPPPVASVYGSTGLWKVFTADTLPAGQVSVSTWYDRINRNPGYITASTLGFGGAVGVTNRMEFGVSFEANRHVVVGRPDQLSFGQQALGFFGDKTPGSPPRASELMPRSSRVPQLRSPPSPTGALTGAAGYYNLLPFAGLVRSGGAVGSLSFGVKFKVLSETRGAPFSFAIRPFFDVPIHKAVRFLVTHPVGTADLQFGLDGIVSKNIGDRVELYWNAGYRCISQPAHVSIFRLAKEAPLGFGFTIPRRARLQLVAESTADIFVGRHTPNTTFGPEAPVDVTIGFRRQLARSFSFGAGYRRPINQYGGDKNGFVISLSYNGSSGSARK